MHSRLIMLLITLSALAALSAAQIERGEIGAFTTLAHGVSGTVHILDSRTIYFQNFNYDGNGPDTVLYYYAPGVAVDETGGGTVIPLPANSQIGDATGRFKMEPYINEKFMVTLPEGISTCDIGTLTVWCRQATVLFSRIAIPRSAFLNNGAAPCTAIGSAEVGEIETLAHEVSGTLHILDPRTIYLENFNYDGRGPDTLLYSYTPGTAVDANGGGTFIPLPQRVGDSQGRFPMDRFTNEGIVVTLPQGMNACDIGNLTVWCRQASVLFGQIEVPRSTFANGGESPCTVIADGSGGLLLNPPEVNLDAERGEVGDFTTRAHGVSGTVHILSSKKIFLQNFNYDGQGPDTVLYYYAPGMAVDPNGGGVVIPLSINSQVGDATGRFQMRRYTNEGILVTLPEGVSTCDMGALAVWCRQANVLFADIMIPRRTFVNNGAEPCASIGSAEAGEIETLAHEASGTVHILDSRTIYLENFNYDGQGPDTLLYSYPPGQPVDPTGGGTIIPLPLGFRDSQGRFQMRRHTNEDIIVPLPEGISACDIGNLTIWCRQANVIFGKIPIPTTTFANNGASPCTVIGDGSGGLLLNAPEFDNCMPMHDTLQLSWRVDNSNSQVRFRLCGCESQETGINQYMGFGLSGDDSQTLMFGADPTITWVDTMTGEANAVDYHLSAYRQCNNGVGACPDTLDSRGTCTNDVTDVTGSTSSGQQCVSFTKPLNTTDSTCDIVIDPTNQNQYIVWGIGRLQEETVLQHFTRAGPSQAPIHLGRMPRDDCARTQLVCRSCQPFENEQIVARESTTFQARIGPAGNERGYMGITGRAGWGINWYINGTLIPELVVERGKTYTFMVEGGDNPSDSSNYHPFYITDSIDGGRLRNDQEMQNSETVFAGIDENGDETAVGKLCEYVETPMSETMRQTCDAGLTQYVNSLALSASTLCRSNSGQPGRLVWTPDENTPDVVYYQCATHQNLGWKILVQDSHAPALHAISLLMVLIASSLVGLLLL